MSLTDQADCVVAIVYVEPEVMAWDPELCLWFRMKRSLCVLIPHVLLP